MIISYFRRKIVQLARFQSEFIVLVVTFKFPVIYLISIHLDLLGPSTAAYVIAAWLDLTIIVDGWLVFTQN